MVTTESRRMSQYFSPGVAAGDQTLCRARQGKQLHPACGAMAGWPAGSLTMLRPLVTVISCDPRD